MNVLPTHTHTSSGTQLRWLPFVDGLTVALLVLGCFVLLFGGFRETVAGIRISVTSWERVAILAAALTAIRHYAVRDPSMPTVVWGRLQTFLRSERGRAVWPAFVATRVGVLVVGYFAVVTIGVAPGSTRFGISDHLLENLPARWDAVWYAKILTDGYEWDGNPRTEQNVVFFPALPIAMRILGPLIGERWLYAGVLAATCAFFGALLYLHRLARDLLDGERAKTAIWALAAYPFSIYYSAPYTEGFFLLGSVGAFYHALKGQWWRAAAWGLFVSLCRPNGFLIAAPMAILALQRVARERRFSIAACAPIVAPVIGIAAFSFFLFLKFGDPLAWRKGQLAWNRVYVGIWPGIRALFMDRYEWIAGDGMYAYTVNSPYDLMHTMAALFVLISIWPTVRRFGPAFGAFTVVNIIPPLMLGGMMSIGRMTSVLFPAFLWVGAVLSPQYGVAWIAASCMLQGLIAALFFTWRPVF